MAQNDYIAMIPPIHVKYCKADKKVQAFNLKLSVRLQIGCDGVVVISMLSSWVFSFKIIVYMLHKSRILIKYCYIFFVLSPLLLYKLQNTQYAGKSIIVICNLY